MSIVWPTARSGERSRSLATVLPSTATGRAWPASNSLKNVPASTVRWSMLLICGEVPLIDSVALLEPSVTGALVLTDVTVGLTPGRGVDRGHVAVAQRHRIAHERAVLHGDRVGTERIEAVLDRARRAAADRGERDHGADADHDPEDGEHGAQRVGAQARERHTQRLEEDDH